MKRLGYICLLVGVVLCMCVNGMAQRREGEVYNVKDYGVKGDGVTDDAPAIQALLDSVVNNGGGTVFFPHGRYRLVKLHEGNHVRAHLVVNPAKLVPGHRRGVMLRLAGECAVNTASSYFSQSGEDKNGVWENGVILFSDIDGEKITDPKVMPTAVLAASKGENYWGINNTLLRLNDISFQVKAERGKYPLLSGINTAFSCSVYTDNVLIFASEPSVYLTSPSKDGHYSAGFVGPRVWCNPEEQFNNIYVKSAFRYGFVFSEHANGNDLSAWNCDYAFAFAHMDHASWFGRIHAQNCKYILTSLKDEYCENLVGNAYIKIEQLGVESNEDQAPRDFNYGAVVHDEDNKLRGIVNYHIVRSNIGADNSVFRKIGGEDLKCEPLFDTVAKQNK